jgi:hypothetical protein
MSNQIVISSGAKVRSLEGVLTGTAGIVNSVPLGGANGVATLDALGKVPLSQLPASVVTYLGTWNAATNTPTLTNGVGDTGDLYICNVAGTVNFGAGPITFAVGDWVIYSGTEWQKSAGASGTVTSVALTESGDALTITGSPITTSGTINIGFAGTGSQYIKGDGTLATFPTTIDQAKRLITEVYNSTGATLTKGTVVYINGGQGNLPTVTKAQANNDANSAQTYGVVQDDITNNNNGFVVVLGSLTDLDTSAYVVGTQLYLSGTTAGAWTSTKPSAPIHLVYVAIVVRSHPTQGVVEVRIQNGYELDELHDVAISAPVNNQGIFYNSSNDLWENKSIATALGYTPANDALVVKLAGTQTITGQKTFSTTLFGTSAEFSSSILSPIVSILDSSTYTKVVRLQTLAATNRDVYFPDLNGTVTLLEGSQTFTGSKTFGGAVSFNFAGSSPIVNYGLSLVKGNTPPVTSGAWSNIYASSGNNNLTIIDTNNTSVLQFQGSSSYTYTFPAATGTIALTSNLSSYVPYTGATTNVDLGINSLATTGSISANNGTFIGAGSLAGQVILKWGSGFNSIASYSGIGGISGGFYLNTNIAGATKVALFDLSGLTNSTQRTFTFPDASGTIALTSQLTNGTVTSVTVGTGEAGTNVSANVATSTTTPVITINIPIASATNTGKLSNTDWTTFNNKLNLTGGTLTGALNGTSAVFSSTIDGTIINSTSNAFRLNGNNALSLVTLNSQSVVKINAAGFWGVQLVGANDQGIVINNTGNVGIGTSSPNANLEVSVSNTIGSFARFRLNSPYYNNWDILNDSGLAFIRGTSEYMRITSGGEVLIGGTSTTGSGLTIYNSNVGGTGTEIRCTATSGNNVVMYARMAVSGTTSNYFFAAQDNTQDKIYIYGNGNVVNRNNSYGTLSSDIKLKQDILDANSQWDDIKNLRVVNFRYIDDVERDGEAALKQIGFIAQEVEQVSPSLVYETKSPESEDTWKSIKTSIIHLKALKALQEAMSKIEQLEAKVSALENKS